MIITSANGNKVNDTRKDLGEYEACKHCRYFKQLNLLEGQCCGPELSLGKVSINSAGCEQFQPRDWIIDKLSETNNG